mmetsp:Transcript_50477/g.157616  ORF Transcript_50477/g.157616 Transcript_50477/m.157616 type:complete len:548 (-) Transcript_50477:716-2359(-)
MTGFCRKGGEFTVLSSCIIGMFTLEILCFIAIFFISASLKRFEYENLWIYTLPWISDTIELNPESGIANCILGPCSSMFVLVIYVWHRRCKAAMKLSTAFTQHVLRFSWLAVLFSILQCISLHGVIGFKIFSSASAVHLSMAFIFIFCSIAVMIVVTFIEWRGGLCGIKLFLVRFLLCFLSTIALLMSIVAFFTISCSASRISNIQYNGCTKVQLSTYCLNHLLDDSRMCWMAPLLEYVLVLSLICFGFTLSVSFANTRVKVIVRDDSFRIKNYFCMDVERNAESATLHGNQFDSPSSKDRDNAAELLNTKSDFWQSKTFQRLKHLRKENLISGQVEWLLEALFISMETDAESPDDFLLSRRINKLFARQRRIEAAQRRLKQTSKNGGEHAGVQPDSSTESEDESDQDNKGNIEVSGASLQPVDKVGAQASVIRDRMSQADRWREESIPDIQDLSEFDPISPAVTLEQRRRLKAMKKALSARKPRTPHEAWEAHLRQLQVTTSPPNPHPQPPAIPPIRPLAQPPQPRETSRSNGPQLATKLRKQDLS